MLCLQVQMLGTPCQYFSARICCALPKSDINVNIVSTVIQSSNRMFVSFHHFLKVVNSVYWL